MTQPPRDQVARTYLHSVFRHSWSSSDLRFPFAPGWFLGETQSSVQCCFKYHWVRLELCTKHTSITLNLGLFVVVVFFTLLYSILVLKIFFFFSKMFWCVCCCSVTCLIRLKVELHSRRSVFCCTCLSLGRKIKDSWKASFPWRVQ